MERRVSQEDTSQHSLWKDEKGGWRGKDVIGLDVILVKT